MFEPGPIRVTSVTASAGAPADGGGGGGGSVGGGGSTVLTATSTTPIVTVDLGVTQQYLVKPGEQYMAVPCVPGLYVLLIARPTLRWRSSPITAGCSALKSSR